MSAVDRFKGALFVCARGFAPSADGLRIDRMEFDLEVGPSEESFRGSLEADDGAAALKKRLWDELALRGVCNTLLPCETCESARASLKSRRAGAGLRVACRSSGS